MTLIGEWLCFVPRAFERRRDYAVIAEQHCPARLTDAFVAWAEELMTAYLRSNTRESWQFAQLGASGTPALFRCALSRRRETHAPVVCALLLPRELLMSMSVSLEGCASLFPPPQFPATSSPPPVSIEDVKTQPADTTVSTLVAAYLVNGTVRVNVDGMRALRIFSQMLAVLPPPDRLRVSFATIPMNRHSFETDPGGRPPEQIEVDAQTEMLVGLWGALKHQLPIGALSSVSLLDDPKLRWLLAGQADLASSYTDVFRLIEKEVDPQLRDVARLWLRNALEAELVDLDASAGTTILDTLLRRGLLSPSHGVSRAWLARVALEKNRIAELSPRFLHELLRAELHRVLASCNTDELVYQRLDALAACLEMLPYLAVTGGRQAWEEAAGELNRGSFDPISALTVLLLERHARCGPRVYRHSSPQRSHEGNAHAM